ncbi:hypothetical protein [Caballeronia sp. LZ031]|nr:hypothetical protein [Caballeronia sp. LZ031]MDR5845159.1 hypothetical protein [Caballeronia sp. LZ031]
MNDRHFPSTSTNDDRGRPDTASVARGLGWFSLALGAAELLAPNTVARAAGATAGTTLVRLYGLREIACGIGILMSRNPSPYLWARVGGDALDLATFAAASDKSRRTARTRAVGAFLQVVGIAALDIYAAVSSPKVDGRRDGNRTVGRLEALSGDRSGFLRAVEAMRGAALRDFKLPRDMRAPDALLPYTHAARTAAGKATDRHC